jgi:hypothetical protein
MFRIMRRTWLAHSCRSRPLSAERPAPLLHRALGRTRQGPLSPWHGSPLLGMLNWADHSAVKNSRILEAHFYRASGLIPPAAALGRLKISSEMPPPILRLMGIRSKRLPLYQRPAPCCPIQRGRMSAHRQFLDHRVATRMETAKAVCASRNQKCRGFGHKLSAIFGFGHELLIYPAEQASIKLPRETIRRKISYLRVANGGSGSRPSRRRWHPTGEPSTLF